MPSLSIPNSFVPGTQAKSSEVNANFAAVKSFVDALAVGTNINAGAITAVKLDSSVTGLFIPVGGIVQFAGGSSPANWMLCDGTAISRTTYASLFSVLGTSYGSGDGSTTFNLPNLKGRIPVGRDASQTEFDVLGETGGTKASSANHTHGVGGSIYGNTTGIGIYGNTTGIGIYGAGAHSHSQDGHTHAINITNTYGGHIHDNTANYVSGGTNGASTTAIVANSTETPTIHGVGDHAHSVADPSHAHSVADPGHGHSFSLTAGASGDGSSNLQPYVVVNYIIRIA